MTIKDFFKTIKIAGKISNSVPDIAIDLHKYAKINVSESAIEEYIKGRRHPTYDRSSIDKQGFLQYFRERTRSTWKELQSAFSKIDEHSIVDCDTNNNELFYLSLLNLFFDVVRIPYMTAVEEMTAIFAKAFTEYRIDKFVGLDPTFLFPDDLPDEAEHFIIVIRCSIIKPFSEYEGEPVYTMICEFCELVYKYSEYLLTRMRPSIATKDAIVPIHGEENMIWVLDFIKETTNYREQMLDKYREIVAIKEKEYPQK